MRCLRSGMGAHELQERLGHWLLETTLAYCRYLLPAGFVSPADRLFGPAPPIVEPPLRVLGNCATRAGPVAGPAGR